MTAPHRITLATCVALLLTHAPLAAQVRRATYNADVPAHQYRAVRVVNIPEGTLLGVAVKLEGQIDVVVVYGDATAATPHGAKALFRGVAVGRMSFSVTAPATSDYYVVLDNRRGDEPKSIEVTIAARKRQAPKPSEKPPEPKRPGDTDT